MSQSQPPPIDADKFAKTAHNVAVAALIACPALALLPPRKLDIYTIGLIATTGYSANYLVRESSGKSLFQNMTQRKPVQPQLPQPNEQVQSVVGELQKQGRSGVVNDAAYPRGWKAQREKEIRDDVEEGKGFADMIMDQIWEVWNQGTKNEEQDSER